MKSDELNQAIELIKAGEKEDGKMLLLQYVRRNSGNEQAWLWLATVLDGKHRIDCLEWALMINPDNKKTREYLLRLNPVGGYDDPYWQKVDYVLSGIPEPHKSPILPQRPKFPEGEVAFKPSNRIAFRVSLVLSSLFLGSLFIVRLRGGMQWAWDKYILISTGICVLSFILIYLVQVLNFYEIIVTNTHVIVNEPKIRFNRKSRRIPLEDICIEESLQEKFVDGVLYTQNWGSIGINQLHGMQIHNLIHLIYHRQKKLNPQHVEVSPNTVHENEPEAVFEAAKQKPLYKGALPQGTVHIKPKSGTVLNQVLILFFLIFVLFFILVLMVGDKIFLNTLILLFWDGVFSLLLFIFLRSTIYRVKITRTHLVAIGKLDFPGIPGSLKIEDIDLQLTRVLEGEWWGYIVGSYQGKRIYLVNMDEEQYELILRIIEDRQERIEMQKQKALLEEVDHFFDQ